MFNLSNPETKSQWSFCADGKRQERAGLCFSAFCASVLSCSPCGEGFSHLTSSTRVCVCMYVCARVCVRVRACACDDPLSSLGCLAPVTTLKPFGVSDPTVTVGLLRRPDCCGGRLVALQFGGVARLKSSNEGVHPSVCRQLCIKDVSSGDGGG